MSVQGACRTLCFPAPAPVQMPFRLGFTDKKCSFFTVKNFTEQKFQIHKNWEMGHFSDPVSRGDSLLSELKERAFHWGAMVKISLFLANVSGSVSVSFASMTGVQLRQMR